jgi:hypothetical protein
MSGSVFLSGGWSVGSGGGAVTSGYSHGYGHGSGRRTAGAVSRRTAPGRKLRNTRIQEAGGIIATLLALAGIRTHFQQVDYRIFRELLNLAISGRVLSLGCDTYLYDSRSRLIAIKRAARFDANGRCSATRYFVCRPL